MAIDVCAMKSYGCKVRRGCSQGSSGARGRNGCLTSERVRRREPTINAGTTRKGLVDPCQPCRLPRTCLPRRILIAHIHKVVVEARGSGEREELNKAAHDEQQRQVFPSCQGHNGCLMWFCVALSGFAWLCVACAIGEE